MSTDHWHDCRRCSGQQQCNCDAPSEPHLCEDCVRPVAERVWIKAKAWAEARRKENAASQSWGRAEAAMLLANPWDPALKTAYVRARDEWTRANKALCEAEEALEKEVEQ
jgi:hypothetical protein